ncbi:hypothetical protein EYR40_001321 [Pleurotus pulmonarius]|nr:hypothetical protein EYR38_004559 [Pleurotus pulmonarius]KAF4608968.1 hypothetical protein EYR40_001321 [Pleurotus pulmonarius]
MGRQSPFTKDQQSHIHSYFPALEESILELDPQFTGTNNKTKITNLKKKWANDILKHELFRDKLDANVSLEIWRERIQRVFTNHVINRMKKRVSTTATPLQSKQTSHCSCGGSRDFVTLSTRMSGRQLFEKENRELITAKASKLVAENTSTSIVGSYQQTLKQMWDSEDTDRAEYDERAEVLSSDVSKNQALFPREAWSALSSLCQSGKLGDAEMFLLYAFRSEEGHIELDGHSKHNERRFLDELPDLSKTIEESWPRFANTVIPTIKRSAIDISHDENGVPQFPDIDLDVISAGLLVDVIQAYLKELWVHSWLPHVPATDIPWEILNAHPDKYFKNASALPAIVFQAEISRPHAMALAEWIRNRENEPLQFFPQSRLGPCLPQGATESPQISIERPPISPTDRLHQPQQPCPLLHPDDALETSLTPYTSPPVLLDAASLATQPAPTAVLTEPEMESHAPPSPSIPSPALVSSEMPAPPLSDLQPLIRLLSTDEQPFVPPQVPPTPSPICPSPTLEPIALGADSRVTDTSASMPTTTPGSNPSTPIKVARAPIEPTPLSPLTPLPVTKGRRKANTAPKNNRQSSPRKTRSATATAASRAIGAKSKAESTSEKERPAKRQKKDLAGPPPKKRQGKGWEIVSDEEPESP